MNTANDQSKLPLIWARNLSGILIGWNVFSIVIFLILIGESIILSSLGIKVMFNSALFYIEVLFAGLASIAAGVFAGKYSLKWLNKKSTGAVYLILGLLLIITVLSFPRKFTYIVEKDAQIEMQKERLILSGSSVALARKTGQSLTGMVSG